MFKQITPPDAPGVRITVDGRPVLAPAGENLAAVLLREGLVPFRTTPAGGAPRAAYCMMGVCFECLAVVDGVPNRQACLETVRAGMTVERQLGARSHAAAEGRP